MNRGTQSVACSVCGPDPVRVPSACPPSGFHVKHPDHPGPQEVLRDCDEHAKMFHVKLQNTPTPPDQDDIRAALEASGITMTAAQTALLAVHAAWVLTANTTTNLTRITDPSDFIRLHIVDSLMVLKFVDLHQGELIDVGSGAGFPGIPLSIAGCTVTLCEARKKKAAYLDLWVREMGLDACVLALRAEEVVRSAAKYEFVVTRAVSSLASLLELSSPLLSENGRLLAMKGIRSEDEEQKAARAARLTGMDLDRVSEYVLPGGDERRTLYVYRRVGPARMSLPRRPGLAQSEPLG